MKKRKLKDGNRQKAFMGESLVAAGISGAFQMAAAAMGANATKEAAKTQAEATKEQAKSTAAAIEKQDQNNAQLQKDNINFQKEQNKEMRQVLLASQLNSQMGAATGNAQAMIDANRIVAAKGKYLRGNTSLRGSNDLQVTDGGIAVPFRQDDDGMIYLMIGDSHNQSHIAPDGKRKTGIGIKTQDNGKNKTLEVQNNELVKRYYNGDTGVLSTYNIKGIKPTQAVENGADFDNVLMYQEMNKNNRNKRNLGRPKAEYGFGTTDWSTKFVYNPYAEISPIYGIKAGLNNFVNSNGLNILNRNISNPLGNDLTKIKYINPSKENKSVSYFNQDMNRKMVLNNIKNEIEKNNILSDTTPFKGSTLTSIKTIANPYNNLNITPKSFDNNTIAHNSLNMDNAAKQNVSNITNTLNAEKTLNNSANQGTFNVKINKPQNYTPEQIANNLKNDFTLANIGKQGDLSGLGKKYPDATETENNSTTYGSNTGRNIGIAAGAAGINGLFNLGGALLTYLGNNKAAQITADANKEAGNLLANAYDRLQTIDPNLVKKSDYQSQHAMANFRAPIVNTNTQWTAGARMRDEMNERTRRGSLSSAAALARYGRSNRVFIDYGNQVEGEAEKIREQVRQQNAQMGNQVSMFNAEQDNQSTRDWMGHKLALAQYNNDIVNQRILGKANSLANATTGSANAYAGAKTANAQGWSNALINIGNTGINTFNNLQNNDYNLLAGIAGADKDALNYWMKNFYGKRNSRKKLGY